MTLDSGESTRTIRRMSYTGSIERNAQPNTYTADNSSCQREAVSDSETRVTATADSDHRAIFRTANPRSSPCHHATAGVLTPLVDIRCQLPEVGPAVLRS